MKRGGEIMIFLVLILLLVPLISAGFFSDFWRRITGYDTKAVGANITVGAPEIRTVYNETLIPDPSSDFNSGPYSTGIVINFTVYHGAGVEQLNDSTATANFSIGVAGETTRTNASCLRQGVSTYYANYTCNVTMWWWDTNGTWTITAFIKDNNSNAATNNSQVFDLTATTGFDISPLNLTWPAMGSGSTNQTSNNDPLHLNNTGNKQIGIYGYNRNVSVNATHLTGETDSSERIFADNFTLSWDGNIGACTGAACVECQGTNMSFASWANVTMTNLTKGNYTDPSNNYTGQEQLFVCLRVVGIISSQAYSTLGNGSWIVQI